MEQVSIEEARRTIGEIVDRARLAGHPTLITRQGKPAAMVINVSWYGHLKELDRAAGTGDCSRTSHDLNDVTELRIIGWTGEHVIAIHEDDTRWARVEAPKRHEGDIWTFSQQRSGVLKCHTDLLGSPSLLMPTDMTMTVYLPADLASTVKVTFEDGIPATGTTQTEEKP